MADGGATRKRGTVSRDREILCVLFDATNRAKAGQRAFGPSGIYEGIREDGWKVKDGWKSSHPMAEWHGVTTNAEGRVIGLNLETNYLAGIIPPQLGELDALEQLDLGVNLLTGGVPKELGKLQALKGLNLSWNMRLGGVIPPQLGDLNALEKVDLSLCNLQGNIPPELGKLHALQGLVLSYNHLDGSIPAELGNLGALKRLNLKHNQLTGCVPPQLGNLQALERIELSYNQLEGCVPPQLGNLQALERIELSYNQLEGLWDHTQDALLSQGAQGVSGSSIPNQLSRLLELLRKVEESEGYFDLDSNPWAEPPEGVVKSGIAAVIRYFVALYSSPCRVRRNSVKVVLVGQEGAGKTSLCRSMKTGRATPTGGSAESTVYADVEGMELNGASVRVYDCAGQVAYTGLLQMFLTPRAVCLVVCNAGAFGQQGGGAEDQIEKDICTLEELRVCDWLRSISYRVPGSDVILVATKCDLAGGSAHGRAQRMGAACRTWLDRWVGAGKAPVGLEDGVCRTSCFVKATPSSILQRAEALFEKLPSLLFGQEEAAPGNRTGGLDWECDWQEDVAAEPTTSMLDRVMNKRDGSGLRGAEMVLPPSWDIALTVLEALELGRDSVEAVVRRSAEPHVGVERKTKPFKGITVDELDVRWKAVVVDLSKKGISVTNPDHALGGALSIREFDGTIVRHETFVFLDVVWLTRILKPLLNHKDSERRDGSVFLGNTGDTGIFLTEERHIDSWKRLKEEGVLEPALARVMWPVLFEYVMPTLAYLGLTFPLELDPAEGLVVLLRLETDRPESVGEDIDEFRSRHSAVLDVRWTFFCGVPPGMIEKILTRCCKIGTVQTFWRYGVLVQGALNDGEGSGSFALVLEYSSYSNELDMKVYGDICTTAPWAALAYAISALRIIAVEFPGLRSRAHLKCPQHNHTTRMTITTSGPGNELLQGRGCSRCSRETGGIGAAAVELVRMVDVQRVRGVVFREVNASFVVVQREYAALRPAGAQDVHSEALVSQQKAAEESLLKRILECLESLVSSAGAPAAIGHGGQDELSPAWDNLQRMVEEILRRSGGLEAKVGGVEAKVGGVEAKMSEMAAAMLAADDGVRETLDVVVTMLMAVRGDKVDTPRQACVLPGDYAEPHGLTEELRNPKVWTKKLEEWVESDFKAGKGVWKKKMRLFLVCAHTHELVPCGHDGRGYDIQRFRQWVRMTVDVAKFAFQVTFATLAAVFVAQLPASLGDAGDQAFEATLSGIQERLEGIVLHDGSEGAVEALRGEVQALKANAYECLRTFVHEMEDTARLKNSAAKNKAHRKDVARPSDSGFVYFEQKMAKVQARTGDGGAQWVLRGHEDAWMDAAKCRPT